MAFNNKGDGGFYTIIIFLALVISALIVGKTMLSGADRTSNTAIKTARDAESGTGESIIPIKVTAKVENRLVRYVKIDAKLGPGHQPIRYNDIKISLYEQNNSSFLTYDNSTENCNNLTYGGPRNFTVEPILEGEFYFRRVLNKEDIISICFSSVSPLTDLDEFDIIISPNEGAKTILEFGLPILHSDDEIKLYP